MGEYESEGEMEEGCTDSRLCDFFFQAEDGIRDLVRSRGLGDVYKRQADPLPLQTDIQPPQLYPGHLLPVQLK